MFQVWMLVVLKLLIFVKLHPFTFSSYIDKAAADMSWSTVVKCRGGADGVQPDASFSGDRVCTKVRIYCNIKGFLLHFFIF